MRALMLRAAAVALRAGADAERADAPRSRKAGAPIRAPSAHACALGTWFLAATSGRVIRVSPTTTGASVRLARVAEAHP